MPDDLRRLGYFFILLPAELSVGLRCKHYLLFFFFFSFLFFLFKKKKYCSILFFHREVSCPVELAHIVFFSLLSAIYSLTSDSCTTLQYLGAVVCWYSAGKLFLKTFVTFTVSHTLWSKSASNFTKIRLYHWLFPVNVLKAFRISNFLT